MFNSKISTKITNVPLNKVKEKLTRTKNDSESSAESEKEGFEVLGKVDVKVKVFGIGNRLQGAETSGVGGTFISRTNHDKISSNFTSTYEV